MRPWLNEQRDVELTWIYPRPLIQLLLGPFKAASADDESQHRALREIEAKHRSPMSIPQLETLNER